MLDRRAFITACLGPLLARWLGWEPSTLDIASSKHMRFAEDVTVFRAIYKPGAFSALGLRTKKLAAFIEIPQVTLDAIPPAQLEEMVRADLTRAIQTRLFDGSPTTGYTNAHDDDLPAGFTRLRNERPARAPHGTAPGGEDVPGAGYPGGEGPAGGQATAGRHPDQERAGDG